jgi:hypothetical protein
MLKTAMSHPAPVPYSPGLPYRTQISVYIKNLISMQGNPNRWIVTSTPVYWNLECQAQVGTNKDTKN